MRSATGRPVLCCALILCSMFASAGQAVKGRISPQDPPPPLMYHGLIPGLSTADDVTRRLGSPVHEASWYAYKMLYPAKDRPGLFDAVYLHGPKGSFANAEAASIPEGYGSQDEIRRHLGEPEQVLKMATFTLLDYSALGLRFVLNRNLRTIGTAYFPHLRPRVHAGGRRLIDLSGLRAGTQHRPPKPAELGGLRAGAFEIKISPVTPEWLSPKVRQDYKPHDELWARCAVFEQDGRTLAFVGADIFGMQAADIQPIRDRAASEGIEDMVLAMSHNHAAPDTIGVYGFYPEKYIHFLQGQILRCVLEAHRRLQPVRELRAASRELPMDGARVIGYIRNARNPGVVDPTLSVIQALGRNGVPITTLVNFACHVEGLAAGERELSADFPGYMCERIKEDGGGQPVFLNGAVGGMITGDSRARSHEEARKTGLGMASLVADLLRDAQPGGTFWFSVERRPVEIPMTNPKFKPLYETLKTKLHRGRVRTEMMYIRLGEADIITVPGELLPEVSFEIQEKMRGFPRILVGLANDEIGYIIPAEDFRDDEYEETMSQGPAAAPLIKETAIRMLTGVR